MTRDEARAKCFETMRVAARNEDPIALSMVTDHALDAILEVAFDALHGIVRVCSAEATEEMYVVSSGILYGPMIGFVEYWRQMSAAGDLTNGSETKP